MNFELNYFKCPSLYSIRLVLRTFFSNLIDIHVVVILVVMLSQEILSLWLPWSHSSLDVPQVSSVIVTSWGGGDVVHVLLSFVLRAIEHANLSGGDGLLSVVTQEVARHHHDLIVDQSTDDKHHEPTNLTQWQPSGEMLLTEYKCHYPNKESPTSVYSWSLCSRCEFSDSHTTSIETRDRNDDSYSLNCYDWAIFHLLPS